jgi:hypothetical protein
VVVALAAVPVVAVPAAALLAIVAVAARWRTRAPTAAPIVFARVGLSRIVVRKKVFAHCAEGDGTGTGTNCWVSEIKEER